MGRMSVACGRFTPKVFKLEDPSFEPHEDVTVMTYLTARLTGRIAFEQAYSGYESADTAFESFEFNIDDTISNFSFMGGVSGLSSGAAACIVLAITSLAF